VGAATATSGVGALYGASLSGEKPRQILPAASNVQYSDGYLLYLRETVLVAQRFDPKSLKISGDPAPVAEKLDYWNARDLAAFTAAHGTLVYRHGSLQKTQPMWVDRTGKEVGRFGDPGLYLSPRPSPDGMLVGVVRPDPIPARAMFGSSTPTVTPCRAAHLPMRLASATHFLPTPKGSRSALLQVRHRAESGSSRPA